MFLESYGWQVKELLSDPWEPWISLNQIPEYCHNQECFIQYHGHQIASCRQTIEIWDGNGELLEEYDWEDGYGYLYTRTYLLEILNDYFHLPEFACI